MVAFLGRGSRTRTYDTWFWRPVLYQLSYTPMIGLPMKTDLSYANRGDLSRALVAVQEFFGLSLLGTCFLDYGLDTH